MQLKIRKLTTYFFNYTLGAVLVTLLALGYFWINDQYTDFQKDIDEIREEIIRKDKNTVRNYVNNAIKLINYHSQTVRSRLKSNLRSRVNEAHTIAENIYEQNKDTLSDQRIKQLIINALRNVRFNHGRGYYFIVTMQGVELLYPVAPELEGQKLLELKDKKGNLVIQQEIKTVRKKGQGFVTGYWPKPGCKKDQKAFPKISFIKGFQPFDWYIGTGEYLDCVRNDIQKNVLKQIANIRYGRDGYIFVNTYDGQALIRDGKMVSQEKNISNLTNPNGINVFQKEKQAAQKAGGDFIYYSWNRPGEYELIPKMSFIKGFDKWEWIIGAGVYLEDIKAQIKKRKTELKNQVLQNITQIVVILLMVLALIVGVTWFLRRKLKSGLDILNSTLFSACNDNTVRVDPEKCQFTELRLLAGSVNTMLEDRQAYEKALNTEKLYFEKLFQNAPESIVLTDGKGIILRINEAFSNLFGYSEQEALGKNCDQLIADAEIVSEACQLTDRIYHGEKVAVETVRKHKSGWPIPVSIVGVPFTTEEGKVLVYGLYQDITEKKRQEKELLRLSETDPLTQAYNRLKFQSDLQQEIKLFFRYGTPFSLIMFDIDHFKQVNDTYGHPLGDMVLKEIVAQAGEHIRKTDVLARWGGEEFVILLKHTQLEGAANIAERLRSSIAQIKFEQVGQVTCSFGVALFGDDDDLESINKKVDEKLYRAKEKGRNRVEV